MKDAMTVIEKALELQVTGEYIQPERTFSEVKLNSNFGLMPCFINECIGLKVTATFLDNRDLPGDIPVTQGMIIINDINTGEFLAEMNGTYLTAVKTGAVSGVGIKYLKNNATSVGLVGTGLQGLYQLIAAMEGAPIEHIYLYNRNINKVEAFVHQFKQMTDRDVSITVADTVNYLVEKSEVIITATTSLDPVLPSSSNYANKLIVAVGAYKPYMREIPEEIFKEAGILYVDSLDGKKETGDINDPLTKGWITDSMVIPISNIVSNEHIPKKNEAPLVFKNVNMALFDTMIAYRVYTEAKKHGIGTEFDF